MSTQRCGGLVILAKSTQPLRDTFLLTIFLLTIFLLTIFLLTIFLLTIFLLTIFLLTIGLSMKPEIPRLLSGYALPVFPEKTIARKAG